MFTGGLQRVARLTVDEYEAQKKKNEEKQAIRDQKKVLAFPNTEDVSLLKSSYTDCFPDSMGSTFTGILLSLTLLLICIDRSMTT